MGGASGGASGAGGAGGDPLHPPHPLSPTRWAVALGYSLQCALNASLWICFSPINNQAQAALGVPALGVNMLSLVYMLLYVPGSALSLWSMERYGLKATLWAGAVGNAVAAALLAGGAWLPSQPAAYAVVLLGQVVGGMVQPAYLNAPSRIAADWFSAGERDMATVVLSLSNPIGNALGSLLPGLVVAAPGDVKLYLTYQAAAAAVLLGMALPLLSRDRPPAPPSAAAAARWAEADAAAVADAAAGAVSGSSSGAQALRRVLHDTRALLRNRAFVCLLVCFGVGLGIFNAVMTVLGQLLHPCGYSDDIAGYCGAALLGAGLVASGLYGAAMERTRAYAAVQRVGVAGAAAASVAMLAALRPDAPGLLVGCFAVFGAALVPLLPVTLENAAEATYPVPEDNSAALLFTAGNLAGIVLIFLFSWLLDRPPSSDCSSPVSWFAGVVVVSMGVALVSMAVYAPTYGRQRAEEEEEADEGRAGLLGGQYGEEGAGAVAKG